MYPGERGGKVPNRRFRRKKRPFFGLGSPPLDRAYLSLFSPLPLTRKSLTQPYAALAPRRRDNFTACFAAAKKITAGWRPKNFFGAVAAVSCVGGWRKTDFWTLYIQVLEEGRKSFVVVAPLLPTPPQQCSKRAAEGGRRRRLLVPHDSTHA